MATNATFDLIGTILDEAVGPEVESKTARVAHMDSAEGIFPDAMVHLGGDEVDTTCWEQDPDISAWLAAQGMTADDGYAYFVNRAAQVRKNSAGIFSSCRSVRSKKSESTTLLVENFA